MLIICVERDGVSIISENMKEEEECRIEEEKKKLDDLIEHYGQRISNLMEAAWEAKTPEELEKVDGEHTEMLDEISEKYPQWQEIIFDELHVANINYTNTYQAKLEMLGVRKGWHFHY